MFKIRKCLINGRLPSFCLEVDVYSSLIEAKGWTIAKDFTNGKSRIGLFLSPKKNWEQVHCMRDKRDIVSLNGLKKQMKVLCVGDSLGMPRDGVSYEDTWFYKLKGFTKTLDIDFIPQFRRALNTFYLKDFDFSSYYKPDLVILQIGICDCAPRRYRRSSILWIGLKTLLNRAGGLFDIMIKYKKRRMKYADTSVNSFRENLLLYYKALDKNFFGIKLIIIKIGASNKNSIKQASPELHNSIKLYNDVIDELGQTYLDVVVVDPHSEMSDNDYVEDGYHVNAHGNYVVYNSLKRIFEKLIVKNGV